MKQTIAVFTCAAVVAMAGLLALGTQVDFDPSTYNPALEEAVTFEVCEPCLGGGTFLYQWDLDGDGRYEISGENPGMTHTFSEPGFVEVGLQVVDANGQIAACRKGILVGESPLVAVRDVVKEDGATFVFIRFSANSALTAPGLEEAISTGWQVEPLETEGALPPHLGNGTLEVLWPDQIVEGSTWTFSYWLYPTYGTGTPALSGLASGYRGGKRVKVVVCGDLDLPG